jgi:hypothetical protein
MCDLVNAFEGKMRIVAVCGAQILRISGFRGLYSQLQSVGFIFRHHIHRGTITKLIKVLDLVSAKDTRHECALWLILDL